MNNANRPSTRCSFFVPAVLCLASVATVLAAPVHGASFPWPTELQIEAGSAAYSTVPGVVANPVAQALFVMAPGDTIEALDLGDGRLLWTSTEGAKPLLVFGDYLIAQAPTAAVGRDLEIAVLRTADGGTVHRTAVALPPGVRPSVDEGLGRRFELQASLAGETVVLGWNYQERTITGATPDLVPTAGAQELSGRLRLDPVSGAFLPLDGAFAGGAPRPDLTAEERLPGVEGTQFRSADAGRVMTSEAIADARVWDRYRWQVRALGDGAVLGEIRAPESWAPFLVAESTLIYVASPHIRRQGDVLVAADRQLRAFDLGSGREQWTRTVRDTAYRGPFPP